LTKERTLKTVEAKNETFQIPDFFHYLSKIYKPL
jgi:hypothetical protein